MTPIANYVFVVLGSTVNFTDRSSNTPTDWLWDFGDMTNSTEQNPTKIYTSPGTYNINLTVTNTNGSNYISYSLIISQTGAFDILVVLAQELPSDFIQDTDYVNTRLSYWRLYLQPIVNPKIPDSYLNDQNYWPSLVNMLIVKLVLHDYLIKLAQEAMINLIAISGTSTTGGNGNIKIMEEGPAKAEWFDSSKTLQTLFGVNDNGVTFFMEVTSSICDLSKRLRILLPMCPKLSYSPTAMQKATGCKPPQVIQLERYVNNYLGDKSNYLSDSQISKG